MLVFDEDMPRRLSTQMENRRRNARRVTELGLRGTDDPDLIAILAERYPDCVLVTGNYWMPEEHVEDVRASPIAIAAIDPRVPDPLCAARMEMRRRSSVGALDSGTECRFCEALRDREQRPLDAADPRLTVPEGRAVGAARLLPTGDY